MGNCHLRRRVKNYTPSIWSSQDLERSQDMKVCSQYLELPRSGGVPGYEGLLPAFGAKFPRSGGIPWNEGMLPALGAMLPAFGGQLPISGYLVWSYAPRIWFFSFSLLIFCLKFI